MKKLFAILMAAIVLLSFNHPADAYATSKQNKMPNPMDLTAIKHLKNGTYNKSGIKLGMTDKDLIKVFGKKYEQTTNFYRKGDKIMSYDDIKNNQLNITYFVKKNGQYRLQAIGAMILENEPKINDVVKRYGKPHYKKIRGPYALYAYNHIQLMFIKENKKWVLHQYYYGTSSEMKSSIKEFNDIPID